MANRAGSQTREESRHWLPSQGVDPAPLTELNAECLGLLVVRAAESEARRPAAAIARRAARPVGGDVVPRGAPAGGGTLHACSTPAWAPRRAGSNCARRGVHDQLDRGEPGVLRACCGALDHPPHAGLRLAPGAQPAARGMPGVRLDHAGGRIAGRLFPVGAGGGGRPQCRCAAAALGVAVPRSGASCWRPRQPAPTSACRSCCSAESSALPQIPSRRMLPELFHTRFFVEAFSAKPRLMDDGGVCNPEKLVRAEPANTIRWGAR